MKRVLILLSLFFNCIVGICQSIPSKDFFIKICTTINPKAIEYGLQGFQNLIKLNQIKKDSKLVIIDYSKKSSIKRMVILDMKNQKIIDSLWVAHGRESDPNHSGFPIYFSNKEGSKKVVKVFSKQDLNI